jgi:hypothetical protein
MSASCPGIAAAGADPQAGRYRFVTSPSQPARRGGRPRGMRYLRGGIAAAAGLCATTAVLLTGCSGSGSGSSGASSAGGQAAPAPHQPAGAGAAAGNAAAGAKAAGTANGAGAPGGAGTTARLAPSGGAQLVYTAQLTVRVTDLDRAVTAATQMVTAAGGYVSGEKTVTDPAQPAQPGQPGASLELKIPVAAYPATLARISGQLGRPVSRQQQAQDVTQQVADTNSRVASDQAAISQLRALLARSGSVGDLLSVQNQINAEESDLESMRAQQRALNSETSYATVSLSLLGPAAAPVRPGKPKPPPSLAAGLTAGWHALRVTVSWLLAALGAVAPIAVALALAGYLGYRARRWLLRRRPSATAPAGD